MGGGACGEVGERRRRMKRKEGSQIYPQRMFSILFFLFTNPPPPLNTLALALPSLVLVLIPTSLFPQSPPHAPCSVFCRLVGGVVCWK